MWVHKVHPGVELLVDRFVAWADGLGSADIAFTVTYTIAFT